MAVTYHLFCFISSAILSYLISAARRGRGPGPSQFMRGKARSESGEAEAGDWVIANSKFQWSSVYWSQTQQTVHIMEQRIFWWRVKGSGVLICSPSHQIISTTCPPFVLFPRLKFPFPAENWCFYSFSVECSYIGIVTPRKVITE